MSQTNKIVFSLMAWCKINFFLQHADTEVGGFCISSPNDLLYVEDFRLIKQEASIASIEFDPIGLADYMEDLGEEGIPLVRGARIWCHTHPSGSASPSPTDRETFANNFSHTSFAAMFIISKDQRTHCTLRMASNNMLLEKDIGVHVQWQPTEEFHFNPDQLLADFDRLVSDRPITVVQYTNPSTSKGFGFSQGYNDAEALDGSKSKKPHPHNYILPVGVTGTEIVDFFLMDLIEEFQDVGSPTEIWYNLTPVRKANLIERWKKENEHSPSFYEAFDANVSGTGVA